MQIKGVLFDLDGTLVNTSELIIKTFEQTIMTHLGKNPSQDEITRYFGLPLKECLRKFDEEKADDMMAFYREYNTKHHDLLIKPFPRISEALSMLEADGVKMAVVTSKKLPMAERGLACFDLGKFFSGIIGFDECSKHKPDPEPMLKGADLLGLAPEQCICVGDSPYDLQSGRTAGCMTAAVKWTYFNWEQMLALASPDFILQTLPDLVGIVKNLNQKGGKAYEKHRNYRGNRNI